MTIYLWLPVQSVLSSVSNAKLDKSSLIVYWRLLIGFVGFKHENETNNTVFFEQAPTVVCDTAMTTDELTLFYKICWLHHTFNSTDKVYQFSGNNSKSGPYFFP